MEDDDFAALGVPSMGGGAGGAAASSGGSAAEPSRAAQRRAVATELLPWVEKYRPNSLSDLVSQQDIVNTISRLIAANRLPHLLFYGPPGTGKTSTILAMAKQLYGPQWQSMTLELNASDDRGIDVVREQVKSFASTRKLFSTGVKLVILDEADAMTPDAQFALRRVIEKYARTTRFCIICNYVSKIIPALQSRCTRFRFAPLRQVDIDARLSYVIEKEGLAGRVTDAGRAAVLRLAGGDMRRVLNVLQATAAGYESIDEDAVYACTGNPRPADIRNALNSLLKAPFADAFAQLVSLSTVQGYSLVDMLPELTKLIVALRVPPDVKTLLLERIADIEYRLAFGTSEKLQAGALVAAFESARHLMAMHRSAVVTVS